MSEHQAVVEWHRGEQPFIDGRYSRGHWWRFAGGCTVAASASVDIVPPPYSVAENVDPEAAFVAALSSCHMLFFLSIAAKRGYVVDSYIDHAEGMMSKNEDGKTAVTQVTLRPAAVFADDKNSAAKIPAAAQIKSIHHLAHQSCFLANSVHSKIIVQPVLA